MKPSGHPPVLEDGLTTLTTAAGAGVAVGDVPPLFAQLLATPTPTPQWKASAAAPPVTASLTSTSKRAPRGGASAVGTSTLSTALGPGKAAPQPKGKHALETADAPPPTTFPPAFVSEAFFASLRRLVLAAAEGMDGILAAGVTAVARLDAQCDATWEGARIDVNNALVKHGDAVARVCNALRDRIAEGRRLPEVDALEGLLAIT